MITEAYRVEKDDVGCSKCHAKATWTVVDLNDVGIGISWEDKDEAENYAEDLNLAFSSGFRAGVESQK